MTDTAVPDEVETIVLDLREPLTLDEVAEVEEISGVPFSRWFDGVAPEGKLRKALLFVHARRGDPTVTLEDVAASKVVPPTPTE